MALKMRFLYYSGKGKAMKALADAVKKEFDLFQNNNSTDIIPPAYSCEKERLVVLAISGKGEPDDTLRRFCSQLDKTKAQNVAVLVDGDEKMATKIIEVLKTTGTNVIDDVKYIKIGGLSFLGGSITEDQIKDVLDWIHKAVDAIV
ncbi:MAG: hypothetical protein IKL59_00415 [Clostridia bacterium]|nr:hypothetical protein [Clostridia bacterium]